MPQTVTKATINAPRKLRTDELAADAKFRSRVQDGATIVQLRREFTAGNQRIVDARNAVQAESQSDTESHFDIHGDSASWSAKSARLRTFEELAKHAEIDLDEWEEERRLVNSWEVGMKGDDGNPIVAPLFQVKAWFKRRKDVVRAKEAIERIIQRMDKFSPSYKRIVVPKVKDGHMLEISPFDAHFMKLCWAAETGEDYDLKIAKRVFSDAVSNLAAMASHIPIEKVLFVVGNDFYNIDGATNATTKGTPQDVDSRWAKGFVEGQMAVVEQVDYLSLIAPVEVVVVSGNHDNQSVFALGQVLKAWYRNCPNVTVDNEPTLRKYVSYGSNLILFTHGDKEPHRDLPLIMATERPVEWGRAAYREAHVGHFHMKRETQFRSIDEHHGVRVRILPSLSASDAWHTSRGYNSQRAAEAFVWHPKRGLAATFSYTPDGGR